MQRLSNIIDITQLDFSNYFIPKKYIHTYHKILRDQNMSISELLRVANLFKIFGVSENKYIHPILDHIIKSIEIGKANIEWMSRDELEILVTYYQQIGSDPIIYKLYHDDNVLSTCTAKYYKNNLKGYNIVLLATCGNLNAIKELYQPGMNLMPHALKSNNPDLIKFLIEKGEVIENVKDVLHYIYMNDNHKMLEYLHENGYDINQMDSLAEHYGNNFYLACKRTSINCIRYLINHCGVKYHQKSSKALELVIQLSNNESHQDELVLFLLEKGAKIKKSFLNDFMRIACNKGSMPLFLFLIKKYQYKPKTLLKCSLQGQSLDIVKYVLSQGIEITNPSEALAKLCKYHCNLQIIEFLLSLGADINYNEGTPLINACKIYDFVLIKLLISHGAVPYIRNNLPFKICYVQYLESLNDTYTNLSCHINMRDKYIDRYDNIIRVCNYMIQLPGVINNITLEEIISLQKNLFISSPIEILENTLKTHNNNLLLDESSNKCFIC